MSGFRPRFFISPGPMDGLSEVEAGATVTLDAEDSHHAQRVLRLRPGDPCEVVVGVAVHAATVLPASGKAVQLLLGERLEGPEAGAAYDTVVALVQAVARPSALDWAIEKSTEAGVSLILLVQTAGSPRLAGKDAGARQTRWDRIAREAAKQSKQSAVPPVEAPSSLPAALARVRALGLLPVLLDPEAGETLYDLLVAPAAAGAGDSTNPSAARRGSHRRGGSVDRPGERLDRRRAGQPGAGRSDHGQAWPGGASYRDRRPGGGLGGEACAGGLVGQ